MGRPGAALGHAGSQTRWWAAGQRKNPWGRRRLGEAEEPRIAGFSHPRQVVGTCWALKAAHPEEPATGLPFPSLV